MKQLILFSMDFQGSRHHSLDNCSFNRSQFKKLLASAVKDNHFMFNKQLRERIYCVGMGSPMGPSFANTFVCFGAGFSVKLSSPL